MAEQKKYCCQNCRKVLLFGEIVEGSISKDCPKCGSRNLITVTKIVSYREVIQIVGKV